MVSDLVEWERMIQRLGRVNRRGKGDAKVIVLVEPVPKPGKAAKTALAKNPDEREDKDTKIIEAYQRKIDVARAKRVPFDYLPLIDDKAANASPGAIRDLRLRATCDEKLRAVLEAATTLEPLRPALTRAIVDAWSMTSLKEHTGRRKSVPGFAGGLKTTRPKRPSIGEPVVRFRLRPIAEDTGGYRSTHPQWRFSHRFLTTNPDEDESREWLVIEKWRSDSATEEDRAVGQCQLLEDHQRLAETRARELAKRLKLPESYAEMLAIAARLHDEGKRAPRWQRAFNAPTPGVYAKTLGPINFALLDGYRHEFKSLEVAARDAELGKLPRELHDLALHLIAAHHGFGRPIIGISGCEDAPPSRLEGRARDVALRFARLQQHWGPWGLAWWESLLRATDHQASRENDAAESADPLGQFNDNRVDSSRSFQPRPSCSIRKPLFTMLGNLTKSTVPSATLDGSARTRNDSINSDAESTKRGRSVTLSSLRNSKNS